MAGKNILPVAILGGAVVAAFALGGKKKKKSSAPSGGGGAIPFFMERHPRLPNVVRVDREMAEADVARARDESIRFFIDYPVRIHIITLPNDILPPDASAVMESASDVLFVVSPYGPLEGGVQPGQIVVSVEADYDKAMPAGLVTEPGALQNAVDSVRAVMG